jgi:hypothetical protein
MFIVHTETMGGKGVYEVYQEMKKVGHDVKIVAIPSFRAGELLADVDTNFTQKFDKNDVSYPCGEKFPYTKCESVEHYKPNYIFVQNPYDAYKDSLLDPHFRIQNLKKITQNIMYTVYGPHLFHQDFINDTNLPNLVDVVFVDSASTKDIYIQRYNFPKNRVVVSGYQTYKPIRDYNKQNTRVHQKETILWLPRWFLSYKSKNLFEGGSTFLSYYHFFYNYAKKNPHINFIIRPHLLLFSESVKMEFLSQKDIDEIFQKLGSLKNVTISSHTNRSLVDDVLASDIVISDGTSALGEVIVADKPIIYLSNGWNNEFNSNTLSHEFKKYIYIAYDPLDIIKHLDDIRKTNYEPFVEKKCDTLRCKLKYIRNYVMIRLFDHTYTRDDFKKILDPVENPAKLIAEYVLNN